MRLKCWILQHQSQIAKVGRRKRKPPGCGGNALDVLIPEGHEAKDRHKLGSRTVGCSAGVAGLRPY